MQLLHSQQFLPITLDHAWDFFSNPANLNAITPDDLVFDIRSALPDTIYEGLFITYRLAPVLNIKIDWVTEITHIKEKSFFVDEQRKGPYNIWHHEHHFAAVDRGVLMTDILHYDIGKSFLGTIAGKLYVHKKVKEIFTFRYNKLTTLFPVTN